MLVALTVAAGIAGISRSPLFTQPARFLWGQVGDLVRSITGPDDRQIREQLEAMADPTVNVAVRARDRLAQLGEPVVLPLMERLRHPEPGMRASAALVLGKIADPRAVRPLCDVLSGEDAAVRFRAAYALGRLKDPQAVPYLAPHLLDPSQDVVHVVIRALEECRCKVRVRTPPPGYEILPHGGNQWQVITGADIRAGSEVEEEAQASDTGSEKRTEKRQGKGKPLRGWIAPPPGGTQVIYLVNLIIGSTLRRVSPSMG